METRKIIVAIIVTLWVVSSVVMAACNEVYYVDCANGDDSKDGTTWANAFKTIQKCIDVAQDCNICEVAEGTCSETIDFKGYSVEVRSTDWDDWDDEIINTIIDGGGSGNVVTFSTSESSSAELKGFTVQDGNRGIYVYDADPTIQYCLIQNNDDSTAHGGGMLIDSGADPEVSHCRFQNNTAKYGGGVEIDDNGSSAEIDECLFTGNTASSYGAGIFIDDGAGPHIADTVVLANTGDGVCVDDHSDPMFDDCVIANNTGDGLLCDQADECELENCTIYGNGGYGVYNGDVSDTIICTCIIWGNSSGGIYNSGDSRIDVTYTDVQGGWSGTGNINSDPLFLSTGDLDGNDDVYGTCDDGLSLTSNSPCIDTGDSCGSSTDICGVSRPKDGDCNTTAVEDMGAHEYDPTCP